MDAFLLGHGVYEHFFLLPLRSGKKEVFFLDELYEPWTKYDIFAL